MMDNKFRTLIAGLVLAGLAVLYVIVGQVTGAPHYDARFNAVVLPTGPNFVTFLFVRTTETLFV